MDTCLIFICISLTVISNTVGNIHDAPDSLRKHYGNNRQKLLDLDYGIHLSSVEVGKDFDVSDRVAVYDSPENVTEDKKSKKRLSGPSGGLKSVTIKPTRCTTGKAITLDPDFKPESEGEYYYVSHNVPCDRAGNGSRCGDSTV
ncbi:uncharacterized protein LOC128681165 isoform X2 [Plodia interpunctella]|uniref:uncharacterized protein LOC128681165 isoform X2 n=1 Tax=Plodia interpunctella TaxID=58824 RepID=UPI00236869AD|nr:uncharacterized protein LOC128681165 isoform X2 [Plodia interpunctella]